MSSASGSVWTPERAQAFSRERGWRLGCNFVPSSASNQIEMWREESFDLPTIERELDFAAGLGFTSLRVFLHDLVWQEDAVGMVSRFDAFLTAASARGLGILPVFFDGVWNPHPEPRHRVHNAGWVQSPGAEVLSSSSRQDGLEPYVTAIIDRFRDDDRIDGWDLFSEPDNPNPAYRAEEIADEAERSLELLRKVMAWARAVAPSQPLTIGVFQGSWSEGEGYSDVNRFSLENSDVLSYHWYSTLDEEQKRVAALRRFDRPILCTEFMARGMGNRFDPHLGWKHDAGVGAYCWGMVQGRIQTEYSWDSWFKDYDAERELWFHDVLRPDGRPYDAEEVAYIRSLAGSC
jgi:hypothetical protein